MTTKRYAFLALSFAWAGFASALTVDFSGFDLEPGTHEEGPVPGGDVTVEEDPYGPGSGIITTVEGLWLLQGGVGFANSFSTAENPPGEISYTVWDGIAASNVVDTETPGFANQYAAFPGGGADETGEVLPGASYGIYFAGYGSDPAIFLPTGLSPQGIYLTNTTYAALAMRDGDSFSRAFEQGDWFQLSLIGYDSEGLRTGEIIVFLADYRSSNPDEHYILDEWGWLDLSGLGSGVSRIRLHFYSSDNGDFGMNTPAYVALDGFRVTATLLAGAAPLTGGWNLSPWFGYYNDEPFPWLYHNDLGWIWIGVAEDVEDTALYLDSMESFVWTDSASYPWLYRYADDTWLYYFKGTNTPALFYNNSTGTFEEFGN